MENKIKELIKKWNHEFQECEIPSISPRVMLEFVEDLHSIDQSQQGNIINEKLENVITVSLVGIKNRTDFRREIENLYVKYRGEK